MLPDPYNNLPENSAQNGLASVNVHVREKAGTPQRRPGGDPSPLVLPQVTQRSRSCFLPLAESFPNTGPRPLRAFSACPSPTSLIQQQLLSSMASCSSADFCRRSYQVPFCLLPSLASLPEQSLKLKKSVPSCQCLVENTLSCRFLAVDDSRL